MIVDGSGAASIAITARRTPPWYAQGMRIDRVYTRGGDQGQTSLIGGDRVSKASARLDCYGTVDELNAVVGLVIEALGSSRAGPHLVPILRRVQNELFNLGCELATPDPEQRAKLPRVEQRHIDGLERDIDTVNDELPKLTSFVLPGGGWPSAYCHLARTVCRRAERLVVALAATEDAGELSVQYLNRLSDALFVWGRWSALKDGNDEPVWDSHAT
jgi:cob(I)alamin adenosyltransferase